MLRKRWTRMPWVIAAALGVSSGLAAEQTASEPVPASLPSLSEYTIHVMAQSHMDPVWRWRIYEGRDLVHDTFAQAVKFVQERNDFYYNQSSAWMFSMIEQTDPKLFAEIDKAVRAGRWCIVGGTWVEADQNLPSGEAQARQFLHGQQYFREEFGVTATVGWSVDSFGHAWSLPQIMRKSGVRYDVITRCGPGKILAKWIAPDGSSVTCVDVRELLNLAGRELGDIKSPMQLFGIAPRLQVALHKVGLKHLFAGTVVGDHGGGPTRRELSILDAVAKMRNMPKIVLDRADRALEAVEKSAGKLPSWRDELNYTYPGCYTSQVEVKRRNRMDEQWLATAEKACALAAMVGQSPYPGETLKRAWREVLFNQFHDILPGTSIHRVYDDVHGGYDRAESALQNLTEPALATVSQALDTQGDGQPVTVYNPLSWPRTDLAWVILDYNTVPQSVRVRDAKGRVVPGQVVSRMRIYETFERCKIVFIARDVPPIGTGVYWIEALSRSGGVMEPLDHFSVPISEELYKAYREKNTYWKEMPAKPSPDDDAIKADATQLENGLFRVTFDATTGQVVGLTDKRASRELLGKGQSGNRLELIDESGGGCDAWDIGRGGRPTPLDRAESVSLVANGPVLATIQSSYRHGGTILEQRVTVYDGLDRIDMTNQTEWRERETMLKVRWPLAVAANEYTREIPYAWIRKPTNGHEVPAQRWVDLSAADHGVSMLNDGRYGHDCKDGVIGITLLRSPASPDPVADVGIHAVTYSLWPHEGAWDPSLTIRRAAELNAPLMTRAVAAHPGKAKSLSLLSVDAANAIVSAFKQAYDGKGWILRVWETAGKAAPVAIAFRAPIASAEETNLIEDRVGAAQVSGSTLRFQLAPHEIKTFRIVP